MDLTGARWRKSGNNGGDCVEVADNLVGVIGVRDSKDPAGPALAFDPAAWARFLALAKHGYPSQRSSMRPYGASQHRCCGRRVNPC